MYNTIDTLCSSGSQTMRVCIQRAPFTFQWFCRCQPARHRLSHGTEPKRSSGWEALGVCGESGQITGRVPKPAHDDVHGWWSGIIDWRGVLDRASSRRVSLLCFLVDNYSAANISPTDNLSMKFLLVSHLLDIVSPIGFKIDQRAAATSLVSSFLAQCAKYTLSRPLLPLNLFASEAV